MARRTKQPTLKPRLAAEALREDPVLGPWVRVVGGLRIPRSTEAPFGYLARAIVYQQLAGRAAATIHGRVIAAVGGSVTPTALARVSDQVLRGAGLSANKLAAVRDLQTKARVLELDALECAPRPAC
ncbi:MAG: hypothetical protein OEZ37_05115, partial [Gemmatimonadota bacterium]|nr:hypothetical protein [Gemmatimonadota bacterium]